MPHEDGLLLEHYVAHWGRSQRMYCPPPTEQSRFAKVYRVAEFWPESSRDLIYATLGMSDGLDPAKGMLELHIRSRVADERFCFLLDVVAAYHRTGPGLGLHHTINLGEPWRAGSTCSRGLISRPYMDGPALEGGPSGCACLWLLPITESEAAYVRLRGVEALERRFEQAELRYWDLNRESVV